MHIGICDDQQAARELAKYRIKKMYPDETITCYKSGEELLLEKDLPDILFLDICMPGINGMETAKRLRARDKNIIIIFITAVEDYVFQAFDVGAFHYLVKPFTEEKFIEILHNSAEQFIYQKKLNRAYIKKEVPDIIITSKGKHITVKPGDIVYAEVFNRKVIIHTLDSDIEYYGKMKELEAKAGEGFYRPHRSYLVNFKYIKKYNAQVIYLEKGQALMAKQNYHGFVKQYLRYNQMKGKQ